MLDMQTVTLDQIRLSQIPKATNQPTPQKTILLFDFYFVFIVFDYDLKFEFVAFFFSFFIRFMYLEQDYTCVCNDFLENQVKDKISITFSDNV